MLRVQHFTSAKALTDYYTKALRGEYYSHDAERTGTWHGKAAKQLGIEGQEVTDEVFFRLAANKHPETGERLTPRTRDGRTAGSDWNFNVPKSVSVIHAFTRDDRIIDAIQLSVRETMQEIEKQAMTRVRKRGQDDNRLTGNLVWSEFVHTTTRPVDGTPDPHLHAHCIVMNATFDHDEKRFKACQFRDQVQDVPYYEAAFHSRLAARMNGLGYAIEREGRYWQLAGMPRDFADKYSLRSKEIEAEAKRLGITNPVEKAQLGARTRKTKRFELDRDELESRWTDRATPDERAIVDRIARGEVRSRDRAISARQGLDLAIEHHFARNSTAPVPRLLESALRFGTGRFGPEQVKAELEKHPELRFAQDGHRRSVTTETVLAEEQAVLRFAREGRGVCPALQWDRPWEGGAGLNDQMKGAVNHVLTSQDRVMMVRGGAGTGKTSLMKEAVKAIESRGTPVFVMAPTADAARGVLRENFAEAETIAKFEQDATLQARVRGGAMWIDEAGLVGTRTMKRLFDLAKRLSARVILSGDTRQHAPVERGDSMRLLESHGGIVPAEVHKVLRQKGRYRDAVEHLAAGRFDEGIKILDEIKAIREVSDVSRCGDIAADYVATRLRRRSCVVISPTHREGETITSLVRAELKRAGIVDYGERTFIRHRELGWSTAEQRDAARYQPGQVIRFSKSVRGFQAGEVVNVIGRDQNGNIRVGGPGIQERHLPLSKPRAFGVFEALPLPLAAGDMIRLTGGGKTLDGKHRLNNGASYEIAGFTKHGDLRLDNGWVVSRDYGQLAHGYYRTSYSAQGRGIDEVLLSQSAASIAASSAEQFYVSVSRGKTAVRIYVDDRKSVLRSISRLSMRQSATEMMGGTDGTPARERMRQHGIVVQRLRLQERTRSRGREGGGLGILRGLGRG